MEGIFSIDKLLLVISLTIFENQDGVIDGMQSDFYGASTLIEDNGWEKKHRYTAAEVKHHINSRYNGAPRCV